MVGNRKLYRKAHTNTNQREKVCETDSGAFVADRCWKVGDFGAVSQLECLGAFQRHLEDVRTWIE